MSLRAIAHRVFQNGRILLRTFKPQRNPKDVVDGVKLNILPRGAEIESSTSAVQSAVRNVGFQVRVHTRRLFVNNVLRRVTNSLSTDLRKRAAKRLLFGDSAPFFALVGVSLASGTGILTKDDELEGVCWEIREAVSRLQWNTAKAECSDTEVTDEGLNSLVLGPPIAKGCNAVVYAARKKQESEKNVAQRKFEPNVMIDTTEQDLSNFPLAVKMMFNYDAESNATSILRAMYRETVPAWCYFTSEELSVWEKSFLDRKKVLPPHPNVVQMYCAFADHVPMLPGSLCLYPDALPARINPAGYGRNMSLFLLMKRYDTSLKQYIQEKQLSIRVATLLLAQLLEGIAHINMNGIAHRDLKSDNILLDLSEGDDCCPLLVVTDFGCCLADTVHGLSLPYHSPDTDKGGNTALMAPEVCGESLNRFGPMLLMEVNSRPEKQIQVKGMQDELMLIQHHENCIQILQWLLCLTTKVLCEGRKLGTAISSNFNAGGAQEGCVSPPLGIGNRRTLPEYLLIASFLMRVKLHQIQVALSWIHNT
ncbi:uncharacterized protein LOC110830315 [Zootermopsis nevadensis]|uniref:uncharacterized protein LOC110830315 n=1 Tax=Zootermopsis nevadensis TaxID=136037 RepID=UPI000B8E8E10|nr:uncharacterized protein LOC110830315 [Zootermopsis nevadensis]